MQRTPVQPSAEQPWNNKSWLNTYWGKLVYDKDGYKCARLDASLRREYFTFLDNPALQEEDPEHFDAMSDIIIERVQSYLNPHRPVPSSDPKEPYLSPSQLLMKGSQEARKHLFSFKLLLTNDDTRYVVLFFITFLWIVGVWENRLGVAFLVFLEDVLPLTLPVLAFVFLHIAKTYLPPAKALGLELIFYGLIIGLGVGVFLIDGAVKLYPSQDLLLPWLATLSLSQRQTGTIVLSTCGVACLFEMGLPLLLWHRLPKFTVLLYTTFVLQLLCIGITVYSLHQAYYHQPFFLSAAVPTP